MHISELIVPLVTPFTDDTSSVSEVRVARLINWHKERGAVGFVLCTEVGEVTSLAHSERKQIADYVFKQVGDHPFYINVTSNTTTSAMDLCQDAFDCGAAAAVVSPPLPGGHTLEEMSYYLKALRRHGNIAVGFLDTEGKYPVPKEIYAVPGMVVPQSYAEKELEEFTCLGPSPIEFWSSRGIAHPVGIFGAEYGLRILERWDVLSKPVSALIRIYGSHRVGKYVLERDGLELGSPRSPFGSLAEKGRAAVDQLLSGL